MSVDDPQRYESEVELDLYRQYREVVGMFRHVVETERRFLPGQRCRRAGADHRRGEVFFECSCATSGSGTCTGRKVRAVRADLTFKDVNVEELPAGENPRPDPQIRADGSRTARRRAG